jgi:hypothetical protein
MAKVVKGGDCFGVRFLGHCCFSFLLVSFVVQRCAAPLPRGERGVANGKPLPPKTAFRFPAKGLGVREGSALSLWRRQPVGGE